MLHRQRWRKDIVDKGRGRDLALEDTKKQQIKVCLEQKTCGVELKIGAMPPRVIKLGSLNGPGSVPMLAPTGHLGIHENVRVSSIF